MRITLRRRLKTSLAANKLPHNAIIRPQKPPCGRIALFVIIRSIPLVPTDFSWRRKFKLNPYCATTHMTFVISRSKVEPLCAYIAIKLNFAITNSS